MHRSAPRPGWQSITAVVAALAAAVFASASCVRPPEAPTPEPAAAPPDPRLAAVATALSSVPADVAAAAWSAFRIDPERFFALVEAAEAESTAAGDLLVVVDKERALAPDYEPADLVPLDGYPLSVSRNDLRLRLAIMDAVLAMDAAARADGVRLVLSSAYRSYAYQESVYARNVSQLGEAEASRVSARAGHSQHQLGTAIDFGSIDDSFASTPAGLWLAANAGRYGFSMSYPPGMEAVTGYVWESWHFRYLTVPGAVLEREYFGGVQKYLLDFLDALRSATPR